MTAIVALTGASGFLGRTLAKHLSTKGWQVRALLRRPDAELAGLGAAPVMGALEDRESLERLVEGAQAVVHCAGRLKARSPAEFTTVNVAGTGHLAAAAAACERPPRFILMSSLAAREPEISPYAASKRGAEAALAGEGGALDHVSLRPPGIYGPGDRATLPLFRQMARGFLLVPKVPRARLSLLHVQDLAVLVERLLAGRNWGGRVLEVDDGRAGGYRWSDLAETAERHLARRVRQVAVPQGLLVGPALANQWLAGAFGRSTFFTPAKLREFFHADWVARPAADSPLGDWRAGYTFDTGFPGTFAWYRSEGWL